MKRYFRVFVSRNLMQFQAEIAYRVEVIFLFLQTAVLIAATAILYTLIFSQTKTVGDWGYVPMLYLYAVGNIAISVYTMFAWGPVYHQFRPAVKTGLIDIFLLKPMSPAFLLLTGRFDMSGLARFVPSFGLLIYLVLKFPVQEASAWRIVNFGVFAILGLILLALVVFLLYAVGFWTTSTDYFHHLAWAFISATSQPTSAYPKVVFGVFSTVVPIVFAAVVPVRVLVGLEPVSPQLYLILGSVFVCFLVVSRVVWDRGLRRYGSVSS